MGKAKRLETEAREMRSFCNKFPTSMPGRGGVPAAHKQELRDKAARLDAEAAAIRAEKGSR